MRWWRLYTLLGHVKKLISRRRDGWVWGHCPLASGTPSWLGGRVDATFVLEAVFLAFSRVRGPVATPGSQ